MTGLAPLRDAPKVRAPEVRNAYRFLKGAHESVDRLLMSVDVLSEARRGANATRRGRLAREEVDILRSAIVMTSAGLDASMTRLVLDAGDALIRTPGTSARSHFEQGVKEMLHAKEIDEPLKTAIIPIDSDRKIRRYYLATRTKASLQGSGDLEKRVRKVLGIAEKDMPLARLKGLDYFFEARNRIVHSLDYEDMSSSKGRKRTHRRRDDVITMSDAVFSIAADFVHLTTDLLVARSGR